MLIPGQGTTYLFDTCSGPARFNNALHCPELADQALFSVSQFDASGCSSVFHNGKFLLFSEKELSQFITQNEKLAILSGVKKEDGLYWLKLKGKPECDGITQPKALKFSSASRSSADWHRALNHLSGERLMQLSKGMAEGIILNDTPSKDCSCAACFMGKSKEHPYPSKSERILKACGDLFSVDGFGPLTKHPDWNGNKHYLVFIDHYSGKSFMFLYSSPNQVSSIVISFLREVETFLGHPIKTLRSDGEGGYISRQVQEYCREKGIKTEVTLSGAHQQNGMSEGFNTHCLAAVRTMLIQAQVGADLWGEAALNYNYTRNKLPTVGRKECPDTIWYGKKPNISHLRSFGEKCFAHVMPKKRHSKIDPRAYSAIFLGYDLQTKAYRLMDPKTHSLFLSRSVQFYPKYEWPDPTDISRFGDGIQEFTAVIDSFLLPKCQTMPPSKPKKVTFSTESRYHLLQDSDSDDDEAEVAVLATPGGETNDTNVCDHISTTSIPQSIISNTEVGSVITPLGNSIVDTTSSDTNSSILSPVVLPSEHRSGPVTRSQTSTPLPRPGPTTRSQVKHKALFSKCPVSLLNEPPEHYENIAGRPDAEEWYKASRTERDGIRQMGVVEIVPRPKGKRVLKNRYVFTRKASGICKARIVLKDFVKNGEKSKYAPVAEDASFKMLCAVAAQEDMDMFQYDVIQAFLNASMEEEVYTELPVGWELPPGLDPEDDYVLLLHKALYGHRNAPYLWNKEIDSTLVQAGYTSSNADACLYYRNLQDSRTYILLHVDDFIIAGNDTSERLRLEKILDRKYKIKHLGEVKRYTNYQIERARKSKKLYLHQKDYIAELLQVAGMADCYGSKSKGSCFVKGLCEASSTCEIVSNQGGVAYRTLTGALIHLSCHSRPDIAFEVSSLCKYNSNPTANHWSALKQLLRYLKYTVDYCLTYGVNKEFILSAYTDSGFATDIDNCRSPGGYVFFMGDSMISHKSKWFQSVYHSSTEAEMASLHLCTSNAIWLRKLVSSFGYSSEAPTVIYEDNQGALDYVSSKQRAGRMRHIDVSFHWIREKITDGSIRVEYVPSTANLADALTKTVGGIKLQQFCDAIGLLEPEHLTI